MLIFEITFKRGVDVVAHVVGLPKRESHLSLDIAEKIILIEQTLEELTGLRVHINNKPAPESEVVHAR